MGSTSARLAPTFTRSRSTPLARSSVPRFIGKHLGTHVKHIGHVYIIRGKKKMKEREKDRETKTQRERGRETERERE